MWRQKCVQSFFLFSHGILIWTQDSKSHLKIIFSNLFCSKLRHIISYFSISVYIWILSIPFYWKLLGVFFLDIKKNWCGNGFVVIVNCKLYAISWEGNIFSWNYLTNPSASRYIAILECKLYATFRHRSLLWLVNKLFINLTS